MKKLSTTLSVILLISLFGCKKEVNPSLSKPEEVSANRPAQPPPSQQSNPRPRPDQRARRPTRGMRQTTCLRETR